MARVSLVLLLIAVPLVSCGSLSAQFTKSRAHYGRPVPSARARAGPGEPLFLTPYIEAGQIDKARELSKVDGIGGLTSYAGFFTVNATYNSNMYFWFFPAQSGESDAPLLLWLQGGPGGSSLFGLFNENGPLVVDSSGNVGLRNVTWNREYHMVYIDNPVGTGFSFTNSSRGLSTNEVEVATNLYSALVQFFTVFTSYQKNDFYVTGESYAGKYVPAIGYKIHMENQMQPKLPINFKGVAIGDGLVDPVHMLSAYGPLLYQIGLADENQLEHINNETAKGVQFIQAGQYYEAFVVFDKLLNGDIWKYGTYVFNITGTTNYYNFLRDGGVPDFNYYVPYINRTDVRLAIHVGNLSYGAQSVDVEKALYMDIMASVADWLSVLMDNYKVLLYNGQLDIIVGVPLTESYLRVLKWSKQQEYLAADRQIWKINGTSAVAGYVRQVGQFQQVVVRGAGHILPHDQPERALDMITKFINM